MIMISPSSRNLLKSTAFFSKLILQTLVVLLCFCNMLFAGIKPAIKHRNTGNANNHIIIKKGQNPLKRENALSPPTISYSGPQTYTINVPIAPLTPVSSGVAAAGYSSTPVTFGSGFNGPTGVALDAAGNIYIADPINNVVSKYPVGGGAPVSLGSGFNGPFGLTVDAAGNVYVADQGNNAIKKIPVGGGAIVTLGSGFSLPTGVAVDAAGDVYVADYNHNAVKEIPAGSNTPVAVGSGFSLPVGVTLDAAGNLYVADRGDSKVYMVPIGGGAMVTLGSGFSGPYGVAVDATGNVFVADNFNNAVKEIPAGSSTPITLGSGFGNPEGIAVDAAGNVYVADFSKKAVYEIEPIGGYYLNITLPAGLSFSNATGIISGTPAVTSSSINYTVTAYNNLSQGSSAIVNITVIPFTISYTSPQTYIGGTAITPLAPVSSGVAAQGYNNSPLTLASGFNTPSGVAADAAGNVYVTDAGNNAVKKIPVGGGAPVTIGSGFSNPGGVAVDAKGNVYVGDDGNNAVEMIPLGTGTPVTLGFGFTNPFGVAVDAAGNVYVADYGNNAVKEILASGGVPITLGSGFNGPLGVAVDAAGNVYVADAGNNAIKKIPAGGGTPVTIGSGFSNPAGVAVDAAGNVFVGDQNNDALKEIPAGGGAPVTLGSGFSSPAGVAADGAGNIYVADQFNNAVKEITPVGGYYIGPFLPAGLTFNNNTGVISGTPAIITPPKNYTITAYNISNHITATISITINRPPLPTVSYTSPQVYVTGTAITPLAPASTGVTAAGYSINPVNMGSGFSTPLGVAVDAAGNVYVADAGNGTVTEIPLGLSTLVNLGSGFSTPSGIAVDGAANVYVADNTNNTITEIPAGNGTPINLGSGFNSPFGVAVDAAGNVYVADEGNNAIKKIPVGNGAPVSLGSGFNQPQGVAVDGNGNVYVADAGNNAVKKIPAGGGAIVTLGSGFNSPFGVAVDGTGNVFVADGGNNAVKEIPAGGGATGAISFGFSSPYDVATDAAGNIYVADTGNGLVKKIVPVGGYYISPMLPAGLKFANTTGIFSGTATAPGPAINYTVTTYNAFNHNSAVVNIKVLSNNANLANLTASSGTLSPVFAPATGVYIDTASNLTTSVTITPTTSDANATVTINGTTVTSGTPSASQPLNVGPNYFTIKVTAQNGTTVKTYSLTVTRLKSADATLSNLTVSVGELAPVFVPGTLAYTDPVSYTTTTIRITPTSNNSGATIKVNGIAVASGSTSASIVLATGNNTVTVAVTSQDKSTTDTYTINVIRTSPNANLSNLTISSGTLTPAFATATTSYTASVTNAVSTIKVTPTTSDAAATVKVNGALVTSGTASAAIPLVAGPNTIIIKGIAFDGTQKTYVITVTRALSSNANLAGLTISSGTLTPAFVTSTQAYKDTVTNATASVTVTPTTSDPTATVTVNNVAVTSGTASAPITLAVGFNSIVIKGKAQDGTLKTYAITVTRRSLGGSNIPDESVSMVKPADSPTIENDGIVVHQGVSPNGDGVNDFLVIDGINAYPDNKLMIINRNGALVYESKGYDNSTRVFDGHSNKTGAMQQPGTYFYSLDYTAGGIAKHKTGFIVLKY